MNNEAMGLSIAFLLKINPCGFEETARKKTQMVKKNYVKG